METTAVDGMELDEAVERVRRGDRRSFSTVIEACHVPVRALLAAMIHDRDEADDLAQQTFVFAFRHLGEYQPGTRFLAWVKAIARNHALDYLKRRASRQEGLERYLRAEIARRSAELAGGGLDSRLECLQRCIQELPELQRSFLRQAHDRRSSLEALARKLQRSALAVRKQISRLYELLRHCVDRRLSGADAST
jgi:RNA polymerase sigma-70 factor (ECF subfamily)